MATSTPYVGTYQMEDFPTITVAKQPRQSVGNTPPSADMGLADLTKWMQNQYALNQYNYGNYYQDQAKAAPVWAPRFCMAASSCRYGASIKFWASWVS
jgi:hypothetical protein